MAYFGKEFTFAKEENYEAFINSLGLTADQAKAYLAEKPNEKIEKEGNGFKVTFLPGGESLTIQQGVPFDEDVQGKKTKSTITSDGDTLTQVQDFGSFKVTYKREYSADQIKVTATSTAWDGVAYRWYKAV